MRTCTKSNPRRVGDCARAVPFDTDNGTDICTVCKPILRENPDLKLARCNRCIIMVCEMKDHYQDQVFYVNILNKASNTISRKRTVLTKYDHQMTRDIPIEFEYEDAHQIIIGVCDDREIFSRNHVGIFEPI